MSGQSLIPNNPTTSVSCAVCGTPFDRAEGYRISVTPSMVPGLGSWNCEEGEHICCSLDHAAQAASICLTSHILPQIERRQTEQQTEQETSA